MKKYLLGFVATACLVLQQAGSQTNGVLSLDQAVQGSGNGGTITVPSVTPSMPHESAFLFVTGSYGFTNGSPCLNAGEESYLTGISAPWRSTKVGSYTTGSGVMPSSGSPWFGTQAFTIMDLSTISIGATASAIWPECFPENDWSTVLALVRNQGNGPSGGIVVNGTMEDGIISLSQGTSTVTITGWGSGQTSPSFLIGYMLLEGGNSTPSATISDSAGNAYQTIADATIDPENLWPWTYRTIVFICPNFYNRTGVATITATLPGYSGTVFLGGVLLGPGTPQPTLVDPVPNLMSGSSVTTIPQLLATAGSAVGGVASDGVAEAVIKVPTPRVGDQVTLTLMNDQNAQSVSSDEDGGLGKIGSSSFVQHQVSATSVDTGQGAYAFAIYQAPVDFVRDSETASDSQLFSRSVSVQIQNQSENTNATLPITIVRPPVILVHGFNDNLHAWDNFAPLSTGPMTGNALFSIGKVDYSQRIGSQIKLTYPPLPNQNNIKQSNMGFQYNAPEVQSQIDSWINYMKGGNNPAGISVAAVQADVVGHSMGGLIARELARQTSYLSSSTFGQGIIHKLITIDAPHLGSQVALNMLGNGQIHETGCLQRLTANNESYAFSLAVFNDGSESSGASGDLEGDDVSGFQFLSQALIDLNSSSPHPIPFAPIAGNYTNFSALNIGDATVIRDYFCPFDPLAQHLTSTGWPQVFHGTLNDSVVSVNSQLNGIDDIEPFGNEVHSIGTEQLGFAGPSVMDAGPIPSQVILLLNRSWKNSAYYYSINP